MFLMTADGTRWPVSLHGVCCFQRHTQGDVESDPTCHGKGACLLIASFLYASDSAGDRGVSNVMIGVAPIRNTFVN